MYYCQGNHVSKKCYDFYRSPCVTKSVHIKIRRRGMIDNETTLLNGPYEIQTTTI